ncbi:MAG TPA: hypothetical protein VK152_09600 [Paludibacter sp.]|nr:hypothetical protein [Paludibacter sp.]
MKTYLSNVILQVRRYFWENLNSELSFWAIITLLFTILDQRDFVIAVLFLSGVYKTARISKEIRSNKKNIRYFLLPISHAEKAGAFFLLNTVYHFIMTITAYCIGNLLVTFTYHQILHLQVPVNWDLFQKTISIDTNGVYQLKTENAFWGILMFFALSQSVFALGTLYFKRFAVTKTFFSVVLILGILLFTQVVLFKTLWSVKHLENALYPSLLMINNSTLPAFVNTIVVSGSCVALPFLWITSYFRLSEKQVI